MAEPYAAERLGPNGPLLLQDFNLIDILAHFDRERIPERVVHAKGSGAHGVFEVCLTTAALCRPRASANFVDFCRSPTTSRTSAVLSSSRRLALRSALLLASPPSAGRADPPTRLATLAVSPSSFAPRRASYRAPALVYIPLTFLISIGNWDHVYNNTPVFFLRDPTKFPHFIHTQKRNPQTHLKDADMFWDYLSQNPEAFHQVMILFSDRGTPNGYRHMVRLFSAIL